MRWPEGPPHLTNLTLPVFHVYLVLCFIHFLFWWRFGCYPIAAIPTRNGIKAILREQHREEFQCLGCFLVVDVVDLLSDFCSSCCWWWCSLIYFLLGCSISRVYYAFVSVDNLWLCLFWQPLCLAFCSIRKVYCLLMLLSFLLLLVSFLSFLLLCCLFLLLFDGLFGLVVLRSNYLVNSFQFSVVFR